MQSQTDALIQGNASAVGAETSGADPAGQDSAAAPSSGKHLFDLGGLSGYELSLVTGLPQRRSEHGLTSRPNKLHTKSFNAWGSPPGSAWAGNSMDAAAGLADGLSVIDGTHPGNQSSGHATGKPAPGRTQLILPEGARPFDGVGRQTAHSLECSLQ